jgi:hypothetical protein
MMASSASLAFLPRKVSHQAANLGSLRSSVGFAKPVLQWHCGTRACHLDHQRIRDHLKLRSNESFAACSIYRPAMIVSSA